MSDFTPDPADVELIALALAGDVTDETDRSKADGNPDEWCAECIGRRPAAINAARIALAALAAAGRLVPPGAREQWSVACQSCSPDGWTPGPGCAVCWTVPTTPTEES